MSKISTVYDTILTSVAALFPSKKRIPNAESLGDNLEVFLRNSWALKIDAQTPEDSEFHIMQTIRTFTIIFSKEIIKTDS